MGIPLCLRWYSSVGYSLPLMVRTWKSMLQLSHESMNDTAFISVVMYVFYFIIEGVAPALYVVVLWASITHAQVDVVPDACKYTALQWCHDDRDGVSNHQPNDCLLNHLFRRRSKKTSKLRLTGLCEGNSPVTSEFPAQGIRNAENVSIWWYHHEIIQKQETSRTPFTNMGWL